jgi:hypothetical protein
MIVWDTDEFSPSELWVKICNQTEFPVHVKMDKEAVILCEHEAQMFGLGLHFGDIMRCKQEGVEV